MRGDGWGWDGEVSKGAQTLPLLPYSVCVEKVLLTSKHRRSTAHLIVGTRNAIVGTPSSVFIHCAGNQQAIMCTSLLRSRNISTCVMAIVATYYTLLFWCLW